MNDFVKREKIFEHIKAVCLEGDNGALITSEDVLKMAIKNIPSDELKQGKWIDSYDASRICGIELKICSICGREYNRELAKTFNFCPNCGMKIKEIDDDS